MSDQLRRDLDETNAWIDRIHKAWQELDDVADGRWYKIPRNQFDHFAYLMRKPTPADKELLASATRVTHPRQR